MAQDDRDIDIHHFGEDCEQFGGRLHRRRRLSLPRPTDRSTSREWRVFDTPAMALFLRILFGVLVVGLWWQVVSNLLLPCLQRELESLKAHCGGVTMQMSGPAQVRVVLRKLSRPIDR